jgi:hypothetical protein
MSMPLPGSGHDIEEMKRTARVLEMVQMIADGRDGEDFSWLFSLPSHHPTILARGRLSYCRD